MICNLSFLFVPFKQKLSHFAFLSFRLCLKVLQVLVILVILLLMTLLFRMVPAHIQVTYVAAHIQVTYVAAHIQVVYVAAIVQDKCIFLFMSNGCSQLWLWVTYHLAKIMGNRYIQLQFWITDAITMNIGTDTLATDTSSYSSG